MITKFGPMLLANIMGSSSPELSQLAFKTTIDAYMASVFTECLNKQSFIVNGSAISNVAGVGSYVITLMKAGTMSAFTPGTVSIATVHKELSTDFYPGLFNCFAEALANTRLFVNASTLGFVTPVISTPIKHAWPAYAQEVKLQMLAKACNTQALFMSSLSDYVDAMWSKIIPTVTPYTAANGTHTFTGTITITF